jgi:putative peptidoglycan lipid II flippase
MADTKRRLSRFAAVFASGTLASRGLGLVRDMTLGALIPAASLDAFLIAFKIPNMFRDMLGEGAANAAFVPVFSESLEKAPEEAYRRLVSAAMSAMLLIFLGLTLAGLIVIPFAPALIEALRPLTGRPPKDPETIRMMVRLMLGTFPYLFFIGMAVFATAPLFTKGRYAAPAWAPVLLNIALILACLLLRNRFPDPAWALVTGVLIGGIAQLVVLYAAMYRHTGVLLPNFELRHPGIGRIFMLLIPVILGQTAGEINKIVDSFFAWSLQEGTVRALFYANRLTQLPLAVVGIAISVAILPEISRAHARRDDNAMRETLLHGMRQSFFLIAPAMGGLLLLADPIVRLLFQRGEFDPEATLRTAAALRLYGLGLPAYVWIRVCVQGFYAQQNTKTPVIIASGSMILNILLNCVLVGPLGYRGLAIATTIAFTINFLFLYALLSERFGLLGDRETVRGILRMALATLLMAGLVYFLDRRAAACFGTETLRARFIGVFLPAGLGAALYFALCRIFRVEELTRLLAALRGRS